jgi:hypothetical protein
MKIADHNTFLKFDKLRDQLFAHKQNEFKKTKSLKGITNVKTRVILPLTIMIAVGYGIYHNYTSLL